jgi:hypothetical protein
MRIAFALLIIFLTSFGASAQLVNRLQEDEKREAFIKAYQDNKIVKILDGKYAIEDLYYFYINPKKQSPDGPYTEYRWTSNCKCLPKTDFVVDVDSVNLIDLKVRNLRTGQTAIIPYVDALRYETRILKRKVKR